MADSQEDGIYFKVTVGVRITEKSALIGPYTEDDLNEHGFPEDKEQFRNTVWELIRAGMTRISKEEAEKEGIHWW